MCVTETTLDKVPTGGRFMTRDGGIFTCLGSYNAEFIEVRAHTTDAGGLNLLRRKTPVRIAE